ncbi:TPA: hypothetical protein N0F65_003430 [Lagenidium giganteum]|uniref:Cation efflux protein cytoplasmic domain-containing protein n=1 Tax=Lagenidium giganteum TaxID=4803 RepID=A0AAV2YKR6_9STRA|nr:TPA: hypothetical protein N0F65_003430 [Lagenidium giganteum]
MIKPPQSGPAALKHRDTGISCGGIMASCVKKLAETDQVALVLQLSVATNVMIVMTMTGVAIASHSLALVSALVENMVDLIVQGFLWYVGTRMNKKATSSARFPAGSARFEPVGIICAASIMMLVAVMIIQESVLRLVNGLVHTEIEAPELSPAALVIVGLAVTTKIMLIVHSGVVLRTHRSVAVEAVQLDNRNDAISNAFAIGAYILASAKPTLWYLDPAGAIVIFIFIMISWGKTAHEQVLKLVGVCAEPEFIEAMKKLVADHHECLTLDHLRAYHSGSKYIVEAEVLTPPKMTIEDAHDIGMHLQFKIEQHEDVERAFVHLDYKSRDYDEHVVSKQPNAAALYTSNPSYKPDAANVGDGSTKLAATDQVAAMKQPTTSFHLMDVEDSNPVAKEQLFVVSSSGRNSATVHPGT